MRSTKNDKIGVAFSGGGIRSAAFSSGVLRRLLELEVPIDFLSCVSGGGYTGTAYVEWKYRHNGKDDPLWHEEFFNNMRLHSGTLCNWRNPLIGLFDTCVVLSLILSVGVLCPLLLWVPLAFPVAFFIDYFLRDILRAGFHCPIGKKIITIQSPWGSENLRRNITFESECYPAPHEDMEATYVLFLSLIMVFVLSFALSSIVSYSWQPRFNIIVFLSAMFFSFTFGPWFLQQYVIIKKLWINVIILVVGTILWMGIPPLRNKASWALLIYMYIFVIKWQVYQSPLFGIAYSKTLFSYALWISGLLFWLSPFLSTLQQNSIHAYYRWKLQSAFYTRESKGRCGCRGFSCQDCFPTAPCSSDGHLSEEEESKRPLFVGDFEHIRPHYICNVLVDNWIYSSSEFQQSTFALLTISPTIIERIDDDDDNDFGDLLSPHDIKLSDAMATSAAVVSYHMGEYADETWVSLQVMLGLTMGKTCITDKSLVLQGKFTKWIPFLVQCGMGFPLVFLPLCNILKIFPEDLATTIVVFLITILTFFVLIALMPTGENDRGGAERLIRWCIVNIFQVRFVREMLRVNNIGAVPPPVLHLSDGGHVENLGLLSLLKRRLECIIIADGGYCESENHVERDLLHSLEIARTKLRCSFSSINGRDILEDIRDHFVEVAAGRRPRCYKFLVTYYEKNIDYEKPCIVGQGIVVLLHPRHPDIGTPSEISGWEKYTENTNVILNSSRWGTGPQLSAREVDSLTCAFCECCHSYCLRQLSGPFCGRFPYHITANQFFTPRQFSAYHREGYRATLESAIENIVFSEAILDLVTRADKEDLSSKCV